MIPIYTAMISVVRPFLIAALVAALAVPTVAEPLRIGARARDERIIVADRDGRYGRGAFGGGAQGQPRLMPLELVLSNVAQRIPGRHLAVDGPFQRDGRWIYRIKWLTPDGRVLIVFADAESGRVL